MTNGPIISFVLPCYNVERYIAKCLDSIYSQGVPLADFEVICVNDCSPDKSAEIIEEYQGRYNNLRLINHSENKRAGGARNSGIETACGEYIWFVDPDDTIVDGFLSKLIDKTKSERDMDIILFNYNLVDYKEVLIRHENTFGNSEIMDGISFLKRGFKESFCYHMGYPWRMLLLKRHLIKHRLKFAEHILYGEETVIFPKSILFASKVMSIADIGYNYRINPESISSKYDASIPAELIYQHSLLTGLELLNFALEVDKIDTDISAALKSRAIKSYINGFIIKLLRTSNREKRAFYRIIKDNREVFNTAKPYMNRLNKLICSRFFGYYLLSTITVIYKIKQKLGHE